MTCGMCKLLLMEPVECEKCRADFCEGCANERLDAGKELCVACNTPFEMTLAHPFLISRLNKLTLSCDNKKRGCTESISYGDMKEHRFTCPY